MDPWKTRVTDALGWRTQVFLSLAPMELCAVLVMVSLELGAAPAFAGIAALLALIPLQVCTGSDMPPPIPGNRLQLP